jgi:tetratricopeptide (TPR) repeat protein
MALAWGVAQASPLDDAKSGLAALDKGDNATAIRLLTSALDSGRLLRADRELAYVKRAEAYLASNDDMAALADADRALNLDPSDSEAAAARSRANVLLTPPTPAAARAAPDPNTMARAAYEEAMVKYEAQKKADADAYAQQLAAHDADVDAQNAKYKANLAAWRAQACKDGAATGCVDGAPPPAPAQSAQSGPQSPAALIQRGRPSHEVTKTATVAPKPEVKRPTAPSADSSSERPITY